MMFLLPDGELLLCESLGAQHQGPQALVGKLLHISKNKIINGIINSFYIVHSNVADPDPHPDPNFFGHIKCKQTEENQHLLGFLKSATNKTKQLRKAQTLGFLRKDG